MFIILVRLGSVFHENTKLTKPSWPYSARLGPRPLFLCTVFFPSDLLEHMARLFHQALKSVLLKSMNIKQFEIASYRTIVLFGDIINDDFIFGKRQFHEKKVEVYLFGFCCLCGSDFAVKKP